MIYDLEDHDPVVVSAREALRGGDDEAIMRALITLSHRIEAPLSLDCGDSSCRSPVRTHGGMRTNGGCRCAIVDVAVMHARMAVALIVAPSGQREIRTGGVR